MKCSIPEISWHNRDPVLSVDIQPLFNDEFYRLASGGSDCHVLIWYLKVRVNGAVDVDVVSDLTRHQRSVNVVRWSSSGQYLASGDDDANIIIWNLKTDNIPLLEGETNDKEVWVVHKILRGHKEDVYDISWAPNGLKLISGSIDNSAIIWDFSKGKTECILPDHKGFVQGVTWDPKDQYVATLSSDRMCRILDNSGRSVKARIHKGMLPVPESHLLFNKETKYFHDDTFKSYFRRLNFSPDGSLLIAPSGCIEVEGYGQTRHATYIFTLNSLTQPVAMLPSPKQVTLAVRCCPVLFELHSEADDPIIALPYRMVIAVATESDVILYDTQQLAPFAHFQKIHYTRITDLTWSCDGMLLIASSTDGFCTLITFEPDELGVQYIKDDSDQDLSVMDVSGCEETDKTDTPNKKKVAEQSDPKVKKPNILEQWAVRKFKTDREDARPGTSKSSDASPETSKIENQTSSTITLNEEALGKPIASTPKKLIPKRIIPTKIGDIQKPVTVISNAASVKQAINSDVSRDERIVIDESSSDTPSSNGKHPIKNSSKKHNSEMTNNRTPNRKSSLLNFFQVTSNKRKLAVDVSTDDKTILNNQNVNQLENADVIEIIDDETLTLDKEDNSIKKNKTVPTERNRNSLENPEVMQVIDDKTETSDNVADKIKLKQEGENKVICDKTTDGEVCKKLNESNTKGSTNKNKLSSSTFVTEMDIKNNTTAEALVTEKENTDVAVIENTEKLPASANVNSEIPDPSNCTLIANPVIIKTPRRIPFVTLSSPKRKKKE